jgi:outer membrane protein assembly factor BamB
MPMKQHEKIRVISGTVRGNRFAVAEWESNIQVWDIEDGLVSKFQTDIVSGMANAISISEDGKYLAVVGYDHNTVTLYGTKSGEVIWRRKDIEKPSTAIILSYYTSLIYIDTENQGAFLLDRKTGNTIEKLKGVEFIRENPYSNVDQFQKSSTSVLINRMDRKIIKNFTHKSFAILDAAFSKDKIICAYSGNPVEAISLTTFKILWTTRVVGHLLEVEYSNELNKVLAIRWEYEKGSPKFLCYINIETGEVEKEINLGEPIKIEFLKKGSIMLTSQGKLYSTLTGQQIKQFNF